MGFKDTSPKTAPDYVHYRENVTAADSTNTEKKHSINMSGYKTAMVQIVPGASANPVVKVFFYSPSGKYLESNPKIEFTAAGAGVAFEFVVPVYGRRMFIQLTGTLTSGVDVYVSGAEHI